MDLTQLFGEVLGMLRRRAILWVAVLLLGILASLFYAAGQPKVYETSAIIQIEQPNIEDPSAAPARSVNAVALQKLQIIEQRVMARDNLLDIARKHNLFADAPNMSDSDKVLALRLAARVRQITDPSQPWRQDLTPTALSIVVEFGDPVLAAAIANELVENVLDENATRRAGRTRDTLQFFASEEARVGQAIAELENRIAAYKRDNKEFLPGALVEKRTQLAELRQILLELDTQIISQKENLRVGQDSIRGKRIQRLNEQRDLYQAEADGLIAAIDRAPETEKDLSTLQRQLQKLTDQYRAITAGKSEAEMGQMLEASQNAGSFRVLEHALPPEFAVRPNRKRTVFLGAVLSAGIAAVIVLLVEMRNPVIWTASQLERQAQLRPVVTIPLIEFPWERRLRRVRGFITYGVIAAVFVLAVGAVMLRVA